jgi:stalled ribosome alternative rescue factor ArfA
MSGKNKRRKRRTRSAIFADLRTPKYRMRSERNKKNSYSRKSRNNQVEI